MKQTDKAISSKDKILKAAIIEFSNNSYQLASLNNICNDNNISKGLIYHYYNNKEDLYLACVKQCYESFTNYINSVNYDFTDFSKGINDYLNQRFKFFNTNKILGRLFFYTVFQPPLELTNKLLELRSSFDNQCIEYFKEALKHINLRDSVSEETALNYFILFQELFNSYFKKHANPNIELEDLMKQHEIALAKIINLMLFGIAKEDSQC
ncbi:MAG: TetR/AcrR family transcriptional regulator [Erysipelotrichaceae bacterium]